MGEGHQLLCGGPGVDETIAPPERDFAAPFLLPVEGVHTIEGRGTVVTGRVQRGVLEKGGSVEIVGLGGDGGEVRVVVASDIESFHRPQLAARAGENVGLLLRGVRRHEVLRGQVVAAPGSVSAHAQGEAKIFVLRAEEGGRRTPFGTGYRPQFFFGTSDVTGRLEVGSEGGLVHPGQRATVGFALHEAVGVEPGMRFALREGGRTIGAGIVTAVR